MAGEDEVQLPSYVTQEQLQKLVQDFNDQLNENIVAAQKNMVANSFGLQHVLQSLDSYLTLQ